MLWADETVDVIGDFIANYPLYQRLNLKDYLRQQDPDDLDHIDESEEPPIYKAETVIKYCQSEGDNPLELIHDQLSAGLHRQSEDECIEIAREASQVLQHVIVSINDEYQQRQSKNRCVELIRKTRGRDK